MEAHHSWCFAEGEEIVVGRHAVERLGGGHRHEAYLAWDDSLLTLVTVKLLRPSKIDDPGSRAALAREAEALTSLQHPVLVRSLDAVLAGDRPHLVLEFLDGPRLSTLIRRYGVILEQLLPLALQLCSALHYMSSRGIVHLDVKPRNVLMSAPPRLIDLSVATRLDQVATLAKPTGTDAYMAPEQCLPERFHEIGPPSDVWGLGVTLYEALARSRPFPPPSTDAASPEQRWPQLAAEPGPLPGEVPDAAAEAILSCLEKKPGNRPYAAELAEVLEPLASELPRARLGLCRPGGRTRRSMFDPHEETEPK
ncbi:MAG TPA: serine/threonine-protein kinase [Gaiellaceae bacterium]